jgi:RHS repeat-associated protein
VNGTTSYSYDGNGNMLSSANTVNTSQNKSFTYNLLNLTLVVTNPLGTITYTYDATGDKLRKVSVQSGVTKTTDYISGIEYDNSTTAIGFIQTEEGKAVPTTAGGYDYTYYLGDNLGNSRITFDTKTGAAVVQQQDDYYPFVLELNRSVLSPKNEYLYNKKELQEEFGVYDFGARFYDPVIARWTTIDPLAELNRGWTPYNYVVNNPIRLTDPDGMESSDEIAADENRWAGDKQAG